MRSLFQQKPAGVLRLAFRLPLYLYRLNLGWLFGHRGLVLVHRGRRSGRLYQTVLEVIAYDPATGESVVASAWGEKADWYRNIRRTPALEVWSGRERYVPQQRFVAPQENQAAISGYAGRHPLAFRLFAGMFGYPLGAAQTERRRSIEALRLVAFRPRGGAGLVNERAAPGVNPATASQSGFSRRPRA